MATKIATTSSGSDTQERDTLDEKLSASVQGDGVAATPAGSGFRPIWQSNSFATQRSFVDDMASLNEPYRPGW